MTNKENLILYAVIVLACTLVSTLIIGIGAAASLLTVG